MCVLLSNSHLVVNIICPAGIWLFPPWRAFGEKGFGVYTGGERSSPASSAHYLRANTLNPSALLYCTYKKEKGKERSKRFGIFSALKIVIFSAFLLCNCRGRKLASRAAEILIEKRGKKRRRACWWCASFCVVINLAMSIFNFSHFWGALIRIFGSGAEIAADRWWSVWVQILFSPLVSRATP